MPASIEPTATCTHGFHFVDTTSASKRCSESLVRSFCILHVGTRVTLRRFTPFHSLSVLSLHFLPPFFPLFSLPLLSEPKVQLQSFENRSSKISSPLCVRFPTRRSPLLVSTFAKPGLVSRNFTTKLFPYWFPTSGPPGGPTLYGITNHNFNMDTGRKIP